MTFSSHPWDSQVSLEFNLQRLGRHPAVGVLSVGDELEMATEPEGEMRRMPAASSTNGSQTSSEDMQAGASHPS
jgi:hypothetical protein